MDMENLTCLIPYYNDQPDRNRNLVAQTRWLQKNSIKYEIGEIREQDLVDGMMHRTKKLNEMTRASTTPFVSIHDADVIFQPEQMREAYRALEANEADFVWPYSGTFYRIHQAPSQEFADTLDINRIVNTERRNLSVHAVGGAIFVNREKYMAIGMENERFISYGPEDTERYNRMVRLGRVYRVAGPLYHLHHNMGLQSRDGHKFSRAGKDEYNKIASLADDELRAYISTWEWAQ